MNPRWLRVQHNNAAMLQLQCAVLQWPGCTTCLLFEGTHALQAPLMAAGAAQQCRRASDAVRRDAMHRLGDVLLDMQHTG